MFLNNSIMINNCITVWANVLSLSNDVFYICNNISTCVLYKICDLTCYSSYINNRLIRTWKYFTLPKWWVITSLVSLVVQTLIQSSLLIAKTLASSKLVGYDTLLQWYELLNFDNTVNILVDDMLCSV